MQRLLRPSLAAALALWVTGCAYYSTSGGVIGGIRSVAVPLAANETAEFGLAQALSERVESAYARDGRLRVADEDNADAVLYLTVLTFEDAPFTFTAAETTEQYRFRVAVGAELVRSSDASVLLELPRLEGWGTYEASAGDAEGREPAVEAALDMVIQELLDRTSSSW